MADITIRDILIGEKYQGEPSYTQVATKRPEKTFDEVLPDLGVGQGMKVIVQYDSGGGLADIHSATYYPEVDPESGNIVHPIIDFKAVEKKAST